MQSLAKITHIIIDMDGVLYVGNQPMPCLREFFAFLRQRPILLSWPPIIQHERRKNMLKNWQGWA
jgi:ribonucleotide monophosphatase NagD (HAD superfamily)